MREGSARRRRDCVGCMMTEETGGEVWMSQVVKSVYNMGGAENSFRLKGDR